MFLENCGWAASGGLKYHTYVDRIGGVNLPENQANQGDQWMENIKKHPFPYTYALSMGSNEVADVYRVLMRWRLRDRKRGKTGTETKWSRWAFKKLTKNAKEKPWFIGIIMRPGWPPIVRRLAKWMWIDNVDRYIMPHHIKRDDVHLNRLVNCHFYYAVYQANYMQHESVKKS